MRCHRPDIIAILAVVVATGVFLTTAAQAQGFSGVTAFETHAADSTCLLLCSHDWKGSWLLHLWRPKGLVVDPIPQRVAELQAGMADPQDYRGGGVHYDFMFNRLRAVMLGGNMDVTLRIGNYHHPVPQLDPYLSISLSGRW